MAIPPAWVLRNRRITYLYYFNNAKKFRDRLVHPRDSEDKIHIKEYEKIIKRGLSSIINIMNTISKGIFRKPLRKQLLDLIP